MIIKTINWNKDYIYKNKEDDNDLFLLYQEEKENNKCEDYDYEYEDQAMEPYFKYTDKNWDNIVFTLVKEG